MAVFGSAFNAGDATEMHNDGYRMDPSVHTRAVAGSMLAHWRFREAANANGGGGLIEDISGVGNDLYPVLVEDYTVFARSSSLASISESVSARPPNVSRVQGSLAVLVSPHGQEGTEEWLFKVGGVEGVTTFIAVSLSAPEGSPPTTVAGFLETLASDASGFIEWTEASSATQITRFFPAHGAGAVSQPMAVSVGADMVVVSLRGVDAASGTSTGTYASLDVLGVVATFDPPNIIVESASVVVELDASVTLSVDAQDFQTTFDMFAFAVPAGSPVAVAKDIAFASDGGAAIVQHTGGTSIETAKFHITHFVDVVNSYASTRLVPGSQYDMYAYAEDAFGDKVDHVVVLLGVATSFTHVENTGCVEFDGGSFGTATIPDTGSVFTLSMWFKYGPSSESIGTPGAGTLVCFTDGVGGRVGEIVVEAPGSVDTGDLTMLLGSYTAPPSYKINAGFDYSYGWHNLVWVQDGVEAVVYLQGIEVSRVTWPAPLPIGYTTLVVGADGTTGSQRNLFKGIVDEVVLYSTALSTEDVSYMFNGGNATVTPYAEGIIGWWRMFPTCDLYNQAPIMPVVNAYAGGVGSDLALQYNFTSKIRVRREVPNTRTNAILDNHDPGDPSYVPSYLEAPDVPASAWSGDMTLSAWFAAEDAFVTLDLQNEDGAWLHPLPNSLSTNVNSWWGVVSTMSGDGLVAAVANPYVNQVWLFTRASADDPFVETGAIVDPVVPSPGGFGNEISISHDGGVIGVIAGGGRGCSYLFFEPEVGWIGNANTEYCKLILADVKIAVSDDASVVVTQAVFNETHCLVFEKPGNGWAKGGESYEYTRTLVMSEGKKHAIDSYSNLASNSLRVSGDGSTVALTQGWGIWVWQRPDTLYDAASSLAVDVSGFEDTYYGKTQPLQFALKNIFAQAGVPYRESQYISAWVNFRDVASFRAASERGLDLWRYGKHYACFYFDTTALDGGDYVANNHLYVRHNAAHDGFDLVMVLTGVEGEPIIATSSAASAAGSRFPDNDGWVNLGLMVNTSSDKQNTARLFVNGVLELETPFVNGRILRSTDKIVLSAYKHSDDMRWDLAPSPTMQWAQITASYSRVPHFGPLPDDLPAYLYNHGHIPTTDYVSKRPEVFMVYGFEFDDIEEYTNPIVSYIIKDELQTVEYISTTSYQGQAEVFFRSDEFARAITPLVDTRPRWDAISGTDLAYAAKLQPKHWGYMLIGFCEVALSTDGSTIVVGSPVEDSDLFEAPYWPTSDFPHDYSGRVYVFSRPVGANGWYDESGTVVVDDVDIVSGVSIVTEGVRVVQESARLVAAYGQQGEGFQHGTQIASNHLGANLVVSGDGSLVLAHGFSGEGVLRRNGFVYGWTRPPGGWGVKGHVVDVRDRLVYPVGPDDTGSTENQGIRMSLSSDGKYLMLTSHYPGRILAYKVKNSGGFDPVTHGAMSLISNNPSTGASKRALVVERVGGDIEVSFITGASAPAYKAMIHGFDPGLWYNISVTMEGAGVARQVKMYLDGIELGSVQSGGISEPTATLSNGFYVGKDVTGDFKHFVGHVSNVSMFDRALAQGEVAEMYADGVNDAIFLASYGGGGVVGYWPLSGALFDASGAGLHFSANNIKFV